VGLIVASLELPQCVAESVDHLLQSGFVRVEIVVLTGRSPGPAGNSSFLYRLYQKWDQRHRDPADNPLAITDCSSRLAKIESLPLTSIDQIRSKQLDVLIHLGSGPLSGEILTAARCGVWAYYRADPDHYRGGPEYFWELYEGNAVCGATLELLSDSPGHSKVLYKGFFNTHNSLSHQRNQVQPYWGASTFLIQKLHELHHHGWEQLQQKLQDPAPYSGKKKLYTTPTNFEMLRWLGPWITRKAYRVLTEPKTYLHWRVAMRTGSRPLAESGPKPDVSDFRWIESPKGRFYADPFLIEVAGKTWAFFEDCDYASMIGNISCAEVVDGGLGKAITVLDRPYHLSYPCLFWEVDTLYMIPESCLNSTIELYRCSRFPDSWELVRVLSKEQAMDTTIRASLTEVFR
jgi:hypothetical protein